MDSFTRKNLLRIAVSFTATDNSNVEPTTATCTVRYLRKDGKHWTDKFSLVKNLASGQWIGVWDSRKAAPGEVEWNVECGGALIGSLDGAFLIEANSANL